MAGPWEKYQQQPTGDPIIAPADPYKQAAEQRAQQDQQIQAERLRLSQQAEERAARAAELQNQATALTIADKQREQGPDVKVAQKIASLNALETQINRVQELFDAGLRDNAIPILGSLIEYLPTQENTQFDAAAAGLAEQGLAAFRVPGVGAQSDAELRQFVEANKPSSWSNDSSNLERLRQLRVRVDATRAELGLPPAQWTGKDFAQTPQEEQQPDPMAAVSVDPGTSGPADPGNPTPPTFRPGGPSMTPGSETGFRTVTDPKWQAIAGEYRQRLAQGQGAREIIPWLRSQGASPETLTGAMAQIKFRAENPNVPIEAYDISSSIREPLSLYERGITEIGSGAAGAYGIGAGQFLSGNTLDNVAPDPERARLAMQTSQAQNPTAYMAGEVTGGVLGSLAGSAGLARAGVSNALARGIAADAAMGGANAAGMADQGGRVENALLGATVGAVGSVTGNLLAKGVGRVISPTGGNMAPLYESGVKPTLGQRVASKGAVGNIVSKTEEALQSVPVVGSAIRGARQEARDQFQIGAFNQALAEVGEQLPKGMKPGTAPNAYSQQVFKRVYDEARSAMRIVGDDQLRADMVALSEEVGQLAEPSAKRFAGIMKNVVMRRMKDNAIDGEAYKKAYSELGKRIRSIRNNPNGDFELAEALENLQGSLDAAARRHSTPEAVELLDAADAGYAKLVRIEDAAARAGGEAGTFTPAQFDRAVQKTSGGIRSKAYLRGDALMQDYAEAGRGLSDTLPNSGTADRVMAGYAVGAPVAGTAAFLEPATATALGAVGAAYAPGVRKVMQKALAPGGAKAKAIAERLRKRAELIGSATGASGVAAIGTSPGQ